MDADLPSWSVYFEGAVGVQCELPAAFVDEVVVAGAQWHEVVDVGGAAVGGPVHVVCLGELEWCVAQRARAIRGPQCTPLRPVRQALFATQQQSHPIRADDDGCDGAQAGPAAHGLDRDAVHAGANIEHRVLMPASADE